MKLGHYLALAMLVSPYPAAGQQAAPAAPESNDILVTGKRMKESAQALAACIARHCPPNEEIAASLVLAEDQLKAGAYHDARTSLLRARKRNARFASKYPVAVANLDHADSVVARNLGLADSEWSSALDAVSDMKAGMPDDDPRVFLERIELGDAYARSGRFPASRDEYKDIAARAHDLGLSDIEATALLRLAVLYTRLSGQEPTLYHAEADRAIDAVTALDDPTFAKAGQQLRVQLAGQTGSGDVDALIASYPPLPAGSKPKLLYAPQVELSPPSGAGHASAVDIAQGEISIHDTTMARVATQNFEDQWVDVAFKIDRDGRVGDVHITKRGEHLAGDWPNRVMRAIEKRRYAPQVAASDESERYTLTSNWVRQTGSLLPARDPVPRLERLYLAN